jgi:hypothetical protein
MAIPVPRIRFGLRLFVGCKSVCLCVPTNALDPLLVVAVGVLGQLYYDSQQAKVGVKIEGK